MDFRKAITRPTLIIDKGISQSNIRKMADKAIASKVDFRPHFKTHQSHQVARWYREAGVDRITVSSLSMAKYFAEDGWNNITVAFPANVREIDLINELALSVSLNLVVEDPEVVDALDARLDQPVNVFVKIDTGYHRTGVLARNVEQVDAILDAAERSGKVNFMGFLAHAGHSYGASNRTEIISIYQEGVTALNNLKDRYLYRFPNLQLSYGDTPTCSVMERFEGVDEVRPGNFVFYDLSQHYIGSCELNEIAVVMACPVVAIHPEDEKIVMYGGGVHFSKDRTVDQLGRTIFGLPVRLTESGWSEPLEGSWVKSLSQEHGLVHAGESLFQSFRVGDLLGVIPVHSCLAINLMRGFLTTDGEWCSSGFSLHQEMSSPAGAP